MSNLNSLFDVVRGWSGPGEGEATITETFAPNASLLTSNQLVEGDVVLLESTGLVNRASGVDWRTAAGGGAAALADAISDSPQLWMVVSNSDSLGFDGVAQLGAINSNNVPGYVANAVVCIKGCFMVETENFVTRTYLPGQAVTAISGQLDHTVTGGNNPGYQPYGEVKAYDSTLGVLTVTVD